MTLRGPKSAGVATEKLARPTTLPATMVPGEAVVLTRPK